MVNVFIVLIKDRGIFCKFLLQFIPPVFDITTEESVDSCLMDSRYHAISPVLCIHLSSILIKLLIQLSIYLTRIHVLCNLMFEISYHLLSDMLNDELTKIKFLLREVGSFCLWVFLIKMNSTITYHYIYFGTIFINPYCRNL